MLTTALETQVVQAYRLTRAMNLIRYHLLCSQEIVFDKDISQLCTCQPLQASNSMFIFICTFSRFVVLEKKLTLLDATAPSKCIL